MLNKAIEIATRAHAGQSDKGGNPYILHPLRVMLSGSSEEAMICGVLHDVLEDSQITRAELEREGFSSQVLDALDLLAKKEGESYQDFIQRIKTNELAREVKESDIKDNMNLSRIKKPSEKDFARYEKYKKALVELRNN